MKTDELKRLVEAATPEDWYVYGRDGCAHLLFIGGPKGRQLPVAQIKPIPRKYQGTESQFDNARLIAAAPDLARKVIALSEAAGELADAFSAYGKAEEDAAEAADRKELDNAEVLYGEAFDQWDRAQAALANLRAVLGENE
jgi:hypothetical protein